MLSYAVKLVLSAALIVAIAEVAKRSSFWAAALASLPLTSVLAMAWLYIDTHNTARVAALSQGIFWLVLPSLVLFVALPVLLRAGWAFWPSLALSCTLTAAAYLAMSWALARLGVAV
jgi:hypothetical protein